MAEEDGRCSTTHPTGVGRLLDRVEQRANLLGHAAAHHARGATRHGRNAGLGKFPLDQLANVARQDEHSDVSGLNPSLLRAGGALEGAVCIVEPGIIEECDHLPEHRLRQSLLIGGLAKIDKGDARRASDLRCLATLRSLDIDVADALTKGLPGKAGIEPIEQRLIGAAVGGERAMRLGPLGVGDIGPHVGATEGVDRLLGVTNADKRSAITTGKELLKEGPLQAVGVLGLVDDRQLKPLHQCQQQVAPLFIGDELVGDPQKVGVARLRGRGRLNPSHTLPQQSRQLVEPGPRCVIE